MASFQFGSLLARVHEAHRETLMDWLIDAAGGHVLDGYLKDCANHWLRVEMRPFRKGSEVDGVEMRAEFIGDACDSLARVDAPILLTRVPRFAEAVAF